MKFNQREEGIKMTKQNQTAIGMDIAKHVFHLAAVNPNSRLVKTSAGSAKKCWNIFRMSLRRQFLWRLVRVRTTGGENLRNFGTHDAAVASSDSADCGGLLNISIYST